MDKEELIRKYELASSEIYQQIRNEAINFVIKMSNTSLSPEAVRGMLLMLKEIDSWIDDYKLELSKRKD